MCFIRAKASTPKITKTVKKDPVVRQQADASVTKTSVDDAQNGYKENIKTSVIGLTDEAVTRKKTLLGE